MYYTYICIFVPRYCLLLLLLIVVSVNFPGGCGISTVEGERLSVCWRSW